jgi:large conductance mechanosensitive channel
MSILKEFQEFALRGNVVDLAVGVIIGAAFNSVVGSVVTDLVSPLIGLLVGGIDFSALSLQLRAAEGDTPAVAIRYGAFINSVISFLITAWAVFMMVKGMNQLKKAPVEAPPAPPEPTASEKLLSEIRDLLAKR